MQALYSTYFTALTQFDIKRIKKQAIYKKITGGNFSAALIDIVFTFVTLPFTFFNPPFVYRGHY